MTGLTATPKIRDERAEAPDRLRAELEAEVDRTAESGAEVLVSTPRHPEVTAALVSLLAEHGMRRIPEYEALLWAQRRARARAAHFRSGNATMHAWLRVTDASFLRSVSRNLVGPVVTAANSTCHDPDEVQLVSELAATIASYRRGEPAASQPTATVEVEQTGATPHVPAQSSRREPRTAAPVRSRRRPRITHRVTVTREQAGLPRLRRAQRERDHAERV